MDYISLAIVVLGLGVAAYQAYIAMNLKFTAKKTVVEKTSLAISMVVVLILTFVGSTNIWHYLVGITMALVVLTGFFKVGMTKTNIYSMSRILSSLNLKDLRFMKLVKLNNGEDFEIRSVGKYWTHMFTLPLEKLPEMEAFLREKLAPDQWEVTDEATQDSLRKASFTRPKKNKVKRSKDVK